MSKELEALEDLINFIGSGKIANTAELCEYVSKRKDIIETALKDYDSLKRLKKLLNRTWIEIIYDDKKLEAFKIIKKKNIDISTLIISVNVQIYNDKKLFGGQLTQEEYDLLKEVLE